MLDLAIVLFYLLALPLVSIINKRKGKNFQSFTKISKKFQNNKLILVATIFASTIGGGTTFGLSEKVFSDNIAYSLGLVLAVPCDIAIAIFILPKLVTHYKSETVGDIMSHYYGNSGRFLGGISAILVSVGLLAAQISVSGRIFEYILEIDYVSGVIISYTIIIIYTTIGGFQSILFANQLQFFAIIATIPAISIFGLYHIGIDQFVINFPMEKIDFKETPELLKITIASAFGFAVINLLPTFIQRALINKDVELTKKAVYIKSCIYVFFLFFVTLNGVIAFISYPEVKASLALPHLIDQIIPPGLQGFAVVGLLAAVMSTADSDLNVISVTLVKDIIKPLFRLHASYMNAMVRVVNLFIGSFAIIIALNFTKIVDLVIFIAGFWGPITLVPLILGLYHITVSKAGYVISSICGGFGFILWSCFIETETSMKAVFIGTLVNLFVFMIFYLMSTEPRCTLPRTYD
ncbi:MAG TPA: sodium:solute symporter family protein [Candidatus Megaira endosymbiont of Nemacystus decipiens]|nr:sodium:solute symporter family protein [Candidatus Megaera endosymbiont of Nemacystus decipiens]